MNEIRRIVSVDSVLFGVVKLVWDDGFEGIADLRPVIEDGEIFAFLRNNRDRFLDVQLGEAGHGIYWLDDEGDEIDFGSESLRRRAERQAAILLLAS